MYRNLNTDQGFVDRELEVLDFWKKNKVQEKLQEMNKDGEHYTVYDGPPTANGRPHIGHVLTRSIKDVIPRYRRMLGYNVEFKAGWDTHGLPVEIEVEKTLGLDGKDDIQKYGVEDFIEKCKESVWKYQDEWEQMSDRLAYSADMEHPYVTYKNSYIESEWWALKKMWEHDLLYQGFRVVPYCSRCGTALSAHEVAQGYKEIEDTSAFVRFKVVGEDAWFSAWTTTPWTLPSNVALTVNNDIDYALIELNENAKKENVDVDAFKAGTKYYVAKDLADSVFGEGTYKILDDFQGSELVGKRYEAILPYADETIEAEKAKGKDALVVCAADYVSLTDGTGIVHTAPAFGEDDANVGKAYDLAFVQLVDDEGEFTDAVTDFAGTWVRDADPAILEKLKNEDKLIKTEAYKHNYPHCWRCGTPLIYYAREEWFIKMTALRDELLENNEGVNWIPESIKHGRFGNFLDNVVDWNLSRERYWGTPLPVWQCACGNEICIGSIAELKELSEDCPDDIELHKPYIDQVKVICPECGERMQRTPEVLDAWFDSGSMPFAQYHYPFENQEKFKLHFPSNFISEAEDQTRGWFYSLMAANTVLFGKSPYENVLVMGLVQDKEGRKMSKHLGNVVNPWDVLNTQGTDAIRWYFYSNSNPWLPAKFNDDDVVEGIRKFMLTLWNTLSFYVLYADIDEFDPTQYELEYEKLNVMDRWLLAKLSNLIATVRKYLDKFDLTQASRAIQDFTDDLSNWYVRRSRERFWVGDMGQDKINAYMTLYTALEVTSRLIAPFVPYLAEEIYQIVVKTTNDEAPLSVHFCKYPEVKEEYVNEDLVEAMADLIDVVQLGRAARNDSGIKNRQPLARLLVNGVKPFDEELTAVLKDELNIDEVEYIDSFEAVTSYNFKPQLRTLGAKLKSKLPATREALAHVDGDKAYKEVKETGQLALDVNGETIVLDEADLIIEEESAKGYQLEQSDEVTVALDLSLDEDLISRGYVREIISKVQNMRKDSGFEVTDRIKLYYKATSEVEAAIEKYAEDIKADVLALELINEKVDSSEELDINGETAYLAVEKFK